MPDYMQKSKEDRGIFERIALYVPGYRGYREKNIRREIDRLVRSHIGLSIKEAKTVLNDLKRQVMENGDIDSVKSIDRISTKIDTYMKSIESAESGYSGIWETMKTTESDLDGVVEWDEKLIIGSEELKAALKEFRDRVDEGSADVKKELREIERDVDDLKDALNERKLVIKGLADSAEQESINAAASGRSAEEPSESGEPKKKGLFRRK